MTTDALPATYQCEQLIYRAALYTDGERWQELAALFAVDRTLIRPSDPKTPIIGRQRILESLLARPSRLTRHVITNVIVALQSSESALVTYTATVYAGTPGSLPALIDRMMLGECQDHLALTTDGWVFLRRAGVSTLEWHRAA